MQAAPATINDQLNAHEKALLAAMKPILDAYMAATGLRIESIEVETMIDRVGDAPFMTGGDITFACVPSAN